MEAGKLQEYINRRFKSLSVSVENSGIILYYQKNIFTDKLTLGRFNSLRDLYGFLQSFSFAYHRIVELEDNYNSSFFFVESAHHFKKAYESEKVEVLNIHSHLERGFLVEGVLETNDDRILQKGASRKIKIRILGVEFDKVVGFVTETKNALYPLNKMIRVDCKNLKSIDIKY